MTTTDTLRIGPFMRILPAGARALGGEAGVVAGWATVGASAPSGSSAPNAPGRGAAPRRPADATAWRRPTARRTRPRGPASAARAPDVGDDQHQRQQQVVGDERTAALGQRTGWSGPVSGSSRVMPPRMMNTCSANANARPVASSLPNACRPRGPPSTRGPPRHRTAPPSRTSRTAPALRRSRPDEVVLGQRRQVGPPRPQPVPNSPPQANPNWALITCRFLS